MFAYSEPPHSPFAMQTFAKITFWGAPSPPPAHDKIYEYPLKYEYARLIMFSQGYLVSLWETMKSEIGGQKHIVPSNARSDSPGVPSPLEYALHSTWTAWRDP